LEQNSPLPWLHIAQVVGQEAKRAGHCRLGVMGTKYLMEGPVYNDELAKLGIEALVPAKNDRIRIDEVIFDELVNGVYSEASRNYFYGIISQFKEKGCTAVILGCTEIPLLVQAEESPLPVLDSTRLLARAALKRSYN
jgi:aspartate racemase